MEYRQVEDRVIVTGLQDFDIKQTVECGQCFRYIKLTDYNYIIVAFGKVLKIVQMSNQIIFYHTKVEEFENIWIPYFDLEKDYDTIKQNLSAKDEILRNAVSYGAGIHILQQDVWECLISFIISQNKQIPHIKQVIQNISERFGEKICTLEDCDFYSFPNVEQLWVATEEEIRQCKAGFRAPYILDACQKVLSGEVNLTQLSSMSTEKAKNELLKIKGVGPKIADCVLLFAVGKHEVFPTDVWVKRVMEYFYFKEDTQIGKIHQFAADYFGSRAGFAQQYLFYYARDKKIGK